MSTTQYILDHKIVAVVRLANYDKALEVTQALIAGGITVLEFTLTGKGAINAVRAVRQAVGDAACVGVGTVLQAEDAESSIDAGAQFLVTPAVRRGVIAVSVKRSIPIICGGFTATELLDAYEAGSELVKLFPAQQGGPRYLKDLLAPLPFLKVVPTGGVSAENLRSYFEAGAVGVGIGGNLISAKAVAAGTFDQITAAARECVAALP